MLYAAALRIMFAAISIVSLTFKRIVTVEPATSCPHESGGNEVCRQHKWPPAFILRDVNGLVFAGDVQRSVSLPKDCVTESQRECELAVGKTVDEPLDAAIVKFDRAATNTNTATEAESSAANQQTKYRVWRRPKDAEG